MSDESQSNGSPNGGVFTWFLATAVLAVLALVVGVVALFNPNATGTEGAGASGGGSQTVAVELGEMYIEPASIDVEPGTTVTFEVTNAGTMDHDFMINGETGTAMLAPGESETFEYGPLDVSTVAWCTVPGHRAAGMEMKINVTGAAAPAAGAEGAAGDEGSFATIDPNAEPGADFTPRDPKLPPAPEGTVHEVTFNMTDKVIEVAPGVTQLLWTFEDVVPGPILRGKVGDTFKVTIVNKTDMDHSIDFHASKVAWNDEMRDIGPGESLLYEFTADYAGIWMYHCGTAPTLHHIGNGMYGAVVIDPPDLAPVDHEFVMVQSEFYLGPDGQPGDLAKMQDVDFDAVVFNGYFKQYAFAPLEVGVDERVRIWVMDDGPSENSSFHVVGTIFDTTYKEGTYLLQPDERRGGSQALDLQPAQGGFVEFDLAEEGYYVMVTHKFSNVDKGALGIIKAGNPPPLGGGG